MRRIRKRWRSRQFPIGLIGERADLTYPYDYLGAGPQTLADVAERAHEFGKVLKQGRASAGHRRHGRAGPAATARPSPRSPHAPRRARARTAGTAIRSCTRRHRASARSTSASCPAAGGRNAAGDGGARRARRACSCSVPTRSRSRPAPSSFMSVRTATGARTAPTSSCRARPIRRNPASTSTRKAACRWPGAPSFPPGEAREDWAILRALSDVLGHKLPYDSLAQLRQALFKAHPHLQRAGQIAPGDARGYHSARGARRQPGQGGVRLGGRRFLSHQSDRARVRRSWRNARCSPRADTALTAAE